MKEQHQEDEPGLIDKIKEYVEVRKDLVILTAADKASHLAANCVTGLIFGICGLFILIFVSFAFGYLISERMGDTYSGFFIVAGFYLLIAVIVALIKDKYLEKPLVNTLIKKMFKDRNEDIYEK